MHSHIEQKQVQLGDAQTILESITDAFFSLNADWEFCYVNRQTEQVLGYQASELLMKSLWEVFPGTVGSEFERMYRKAAEEQRAVAFSSYYPDHGRWYEVNVYPAQGGLSVYFRDITARIQEQARRDAVLELSDILRELATPEEIIYQASRIVGKTLGVSRAGYGTIAAGAETMQVLHEWTAAGVEPLAASLDLRHYGSFIDDLKAGKFVCVTDVTSDYRTAAAPAALSERRARAFVNVPIIEQQQLVAVMYVNHVSARDWLPEELVFFREVAERTRTASERLRHQQALASLAASAERRLWLYETFLENSPDLAYVFDLNHRFSYANKVLLGMWGRNWDEAIGKNCLELGYEPWHAAMHDREIEQVIATRQSVRGEVPFDGAYGRRIYEYIFVPVFGADGEVEAIAGTTRDVTERKRVEEALAEANRRKDEFLAMLAHELRNPLAPISAAAEVLERFTLDEQRARSTSQIIIRQVKHMTALIDDLLDVSRVTQGLVTLHKLPIDLKSAVSSAMEQVRPFIEAQGHRLRFDLGAESAYVLGDLKRLVQIVTNLLNNAAKYTPQGGQIGVSIAVDAALLTLTVEDNGIGIAPELQPVVFDLFTQAERTSDRAQGGLGIGLALAKNLTEMHGGEISCRSEGAGKGSKFTILLPRHLPVPGGAASQEEGGATAPAGQARRILVVDDNVDAAGILALYLEASGHQVFIEHAATAALARARLERPEVCILDIGLPEIDGNELARRLRAQPETAPALLIAVTGYSQEKDRLAAAAAGFDQFFVKPIDASKLVALLDSSGRSRMD